MRVAPVAPSRSAAPSSWPSYKYRSILDFPVDGRRLRGNSDEVPMMKSQLGLIICLTGLAGCAGGRGWVSLQPRTPGVITGAEMRVAGIEDAYQALRWLGAGSLVRAGELRRDPQAPEATVVYIDELRSGGVDVLHRIPTSWVASIWVVRARDGDARFSSGARGVAIVVTTVRPD